MGSFDCVAVRFANGNVAQDDMEKSVKKYYVYIVCSSSGTLYIGMTNNIERRMWEHKSGEFEGFASKYGCDRLVYYEGFDDVRRAIDREKQLKGWVRRKKIADRSIEPALARPGREMGSADGIFWRIDKDR